MSKLLKRDQQLDTLRAEYRRRRAAKKSADALEPKPDPVLLLTYQPSPEPVTLEPVAVFREPQPPQDPDIGAPSPVRLRRPWLRLPAVRWALSAVAACGVLMAIAPRVRRSAVAIVPAPNVSIASSTAAPQSSLSLAPSANRQSDAERRAQEMDRALAETQRVMALMDKAMREAARAYASTPAPSEHAGPSHTDTSS